MSNWWPWDNRDSGKQISCYTAGGWVTGRGKSALSTGVALGISASLQGRPQAQQSLTNTGKSFFGGGAVCQHWKRSRTWKERRQIWNRGYSWKKCCSRRWSDLNTVLLIIPQNAMLCDTLKLNKLKIYESHTKHCFLYVLYSLSTLYTIFPFLKFTRVITTCKCLGNVLCHSKAAPHGQVTPIAMSMIIFAKKLLRKHCWWLENTERKGISPNATLLKIMHVNCFHGHWAHAFRSKSNQTLRTNDTFQVGFSN